MNKVLGVFLGLIGLLIACCAFALLVPSLGSWQNPFAAFSDHAQVAAQNTAINLSGVKGRVSDALERSKDSISAYTGMTSDQVDAVVEDLAVDDWQASVLPDTATATDTYDGSAVGIDGTVTLYDDPRYVTVDAYGQTVTLAVPESAQGYLGYLGYLGY